MRKKLTEEQVEAAVTKLYKDVCKSIPEGDSIAVIGIRTRGQTLAERLVKRLSQDYPKLSVQSGILDITLYRDDLSRRRGVPLVRATEIDFDLEDMWVLLVDDVLETGRSIRAALDALHDFGRIKTVKLAVLIDRGGHELPIAADFVGRKLKAGAKQRVQVRFKENDGEEGVFIISKSSNED